MGIDRKIKRNAEKENAKRMRSISEQKYGADKAKFMEEMEIAMSSWTRRLKYFYKSLPTKQSKRLFWIGMPLMIPMIIVWGVIATLKLDIMWMYSKSIFHSIFK